LKSKPAGAGGGHADFPGAGMFLQKQTAKGKKRPGGKSTLSTAPECIWLRQQQPGGKSHDAAEMRETSLSQLNHFRT
jgi:hypothetical protein